jgi:hypothetical protein
MESMPPTRRAKINGAEQTSASHAKGPAVIMMIDRSSPLAWKKSARRETLFDFAISPVSETLSRIIHVAAEFI